jgi:hypothetical protein
MSYWLTLIDPATEQAAIVPDGHDLRGGTYALGGSAEATLNVTYNYANHFRRVLGELGIRTLYGLTGEASLPVLSEAIAQLGTNRSDDYWEPTEGNARAALENLRLLARACPTATWSGD